MAVKSEYDRAMYRITTMTMRMWLGETLYPRELAEEFNTSVRTIQKDLNERLTFLPIERSASGGYSLPKNYKLAGMSNPHERIVLSLMQSLMQQVNPEFTNIMQKLIKQEGIQSSTFLFDLGFEEIGTAISNFYTLCQVIEFRQSVCFDYTNKYGTTQEYHADPYRIANFKGFWYLVARDHGDSKLKTFALRSIDKLQTSPQNYAIDEAIEQEISTTYGDINTAWFKAEKYHVTLKAYNDAKRYIRRNPPTNIEIREEDDESLTLQMQYHNDLEVLSYVKHWMPDITIENHPQLEQKLFCQVESYLDKRAEHHKQQNEPKWENA